MNELAPEDALRINVLLANQPQAIRIDESRMCLYGLTAAGEAQIQLNPVCRDEQYVKQVRELLSNHYLGSPSGYPVSIQRWVRMGQSRIENHEELLLLGEPNAVIAVVYSEGLTDELARRAWWAMEDAENARQMLRSADIAQAEVGRRLADFLVEFLPFETEAQEIMETVRLVLQPDLISAHTKENLWQRAKRKNAIYVGFLAALPDDLPGSTSANANFSELSDDLKSLSEQGNELAGLLCKIFSSQGQQWLDTLSRVFEKPASQDVINLALGVLANYFSAAAADTPLDEPLEQLIYEANSWVANSEDESVKAILTLFPQLAPQLQAVRVLSAAGYNMVRPVFSKSTAMGSLMRKQLKPVMSLLQQQLGCLRAGQM